MKDQLEVLITADKKFSINFSEVNIKFCFSLPYNSDESFLYVNKTEICKSKAKDNTSLYNFCLGIVIKDFTKNKQTEFLWMVLYMLFQLTLLILINI